MIILLGEEHYCFGVVCDPVWLLALCRNCHAEIHQQQGDGPYSKEAQIKKLNGKPRGGARPGAGRKPTGPKTVSTNFTLSPETFAGLKAIPRGTRSKFVDAAIRAKLAES